MNSIYRLNRVAIACSTETSEYSGLTPLKAFIVGGLPEFRRLYASTRGQLRQQPNSEWLHSCSWFLRAESDHLVTIFKSWLHHYRLFRRDHKADPRLAGTITTVGAIDRITKSLPSKPFRMIGVILVPFLRIVFDVPGADIHAKIHYRLHDLYTRYLYPGH